MKKLLIALISVVLLLTLCSCSESSHLKFKLKDDGTYSVSGKLSAQFQEEIVIPETYKGKPVTEIADNAFDVHVKFFNAFGIDVNRIINVTIPDSVTSIGDHAFYSCESLESIIIPEGVTSIGYRAFYKCYSLESVTIPGTVTSIGDEAFGSCNPLDNVVIPDSITSISNGLFYYCHSLKNITIPDSVTSIGENAFYGCKSLTSIVIPDGVTSIADGTFQYCESLENVIIPAGVTSIGDNAFDECNSLISITIPDSVTSIGNEAFDWVRSLKCIWIPSSVVEVGEYAFFGIDVIGTSHSVKPSGWHEGWYYSYGSAVVWGVDNINVTDDGFVWTLKDGNAWICGYSGDSVEALTIPTMVDGYTVTGINAEAFSVYSFKSVTIPDTVTYIGTGAFDGCSNLIYNKFDNAYYLGNDSNPYLYLAKTEGYSGCVINDNTKIIDGKAFWRWNYDSITIPASVVYIGEYISEYSYSSSLSSITVHEDNQYYKSIDGALYTKDGKTLIRYAPESADTTVVVPEGVTKIADRAFYGAKNLKSIIIPDTVTDIGHDVFKNCDSNFTVYCEAESRPDSWSKDWNLHSDGKYYIPVVWGYTGE